MTITKPEFEALKYLDSNPDARNIVLYLGGNTLVSPKHTATGYHFMEHFRIEPSKLEETLLHLKDTGLLRTGEQIGMSPVFSPSYLLSGFGYKVISNLKSNLDIKLLVILKAIS